VSGAPHRFDPVEFYVSGVGRIGRTAFLFGIAGVVAAFEVYDRAGAWVHWLTGWVVYPILLCAAASVLSKRLHDRGQAGWWSALPIFAYPWIRPWPEGVLAGICLGVVLWFGAALVFLPGERGFNRFGPRG